LVEPGPPLPPDEVARTARQVLLPGLGETGQRRLAAARVLVVGAGGLGSPVLSYLAAAGVGTLGVVDDDIVDVSNLHRQVIHTVSEVGQPKVLSAARRVRGLSPHIDVEAYQVRLDTDNAERLLDGWDVVLDCTDSFTTRYTVADACAALGVPLVWGTLLGLDGQVSVFWSRPPAGAPALRLRDLFPQPPAPGTVPLCEQAGVLGALCGIVGAMMAAEAVKLVVGFGDVLLGRVAVVDVATMRVHEVPLVPAGSAVVGDPDALVGSGARRSGALARHGGGGVP
jgi:adenylyltransferase/sulfurtransferase